MTYYPSRGVNLAILPETLIPPERLKNNRAIFKINENDYRLIVEVNYQKGWVFIKFVGTHAEYNKVNADTVNQFKPTK